MEGGENDLKAVWVWELIAGGDIYYKGFVTVRMRGNEDSDCDAGWSRRCPC